MDERNPSICAFARYVARAIRRRRVSAGISKAQMASYANIDESEYAKYEDKKAVMPFHLFMRCIESLGMNIATDIIDRIPENVSISEIPKEMTDSIKDEDMIRSVQTLSVAIRNNISVRKTIRELIGTDVAQPDFSSESLAV